MAAVSKREQIISEALKLFYKDGFNATGIDHIIKVAGVSKKTLYNHFKSKDELVLTTLRRRDELFRNNLMRETERLGKTAKEQLLTIFDVHGKWFKENTFSGCMFINAAAEFPLHDDPKHIFSAEHKRLVREYIEKLAIQANANDPELLSQQLNLLLEGAIVSAYVSGDVKAAELAKQMATVFVDQAIDA